MNAVAVPQSNFSSADNNWCSNILAASLQATPQHCKINIQIYLCLNENKLEGDNSYLARTCHNDNLHGSYTFPLVLIFLLMY